MNPTNNGNNFNRLINSTPAKVTPPIEKGFQVPERYRIKLPEHGGIAGSNKGLFSIPSVDKSFGSQRHLVAKADLDGDWRGVIVRCVKNQNGNLLPKTPSWIEMCQIKQLFWTEDALVIQMMPAATLIGLAQDLVLWQWIGEQAHDVHMPSPPAEMFANAFGDAQEPSDSVS